MIKNFSDNPFDFFNLTNINNENFLNDDDLNDNKSDVLDKEQELNDDIFILSEKQIFDDILLEKNKKITDSNLIENKYQNNNIINNKIYRIVKIKENFLDEMKKNFLEVEKVAVQEYREWYINQAIILKAIEERSSQDKITQNLSLALLQGFIKASPMDSSWIKLFNVQTSPIYSDYNSCYYRYGTPFSTGAREAYSEHLKKNVYLLNSFLLFREAAAREVPPALQNAFKKIGSVEDFKKDLEILNDFIANNLSSKEFNIIFDLEAFAIHEEKGKHSLLKQSKVWECSLQPLIKEIISTKFSDPNSNHDQINPIIQKKIDQRISTIEKILVPVALTTFHSQYILHNIKNFEFSPFLNKHGLRLNPDVEINAWLKVASLEEILNTLNVPLAELDIRGKEKIPVLCKNFEDFLTSPIVEKFKKLSENEYHPPYLKIQSKAVVKLLEGFKNCNIDKEFKNKELQDLLQFSYYRIFNAMSEAILWKDDLISFNNKIEMIHQEIQTILLLLEPYKKNDLSNTIKEKMKINPIVDVDLISGIYLSPSAMHGFSTALSGIERQKGCNALNLGVLKDTYFEQGELLNDSQAYAVRHISDFHDIEDLPKNEKDKLDVFVCEFHHNISKQRQHYQTENIKKYVHSMIDNKIIAKSFTIIIDSSLDLEKSNDLRSFFEDKRIKKMINEGSLNVVLIRTQKLDVIGMDNYTGGMAICINRKSFETFNQRMAHENNQQTGIAYQGFTHFHQYASKEIEKWRKKSMQNTQYVYNMMKHSIPQTMYDSFSPNKTWMQISKIEDEKCLFLDIKFPGCKGAVKIFASEFLDYIAEEKLPVSLRPSFGFVTTNMMCLVGKNGDDDCVRLNFGLESKQTLDKYGQFIINVQNKIESTIKLYEDESDLYDKRHPFLLFKKNYKNENLDKNHFLAPLFWQ